MNKTAAGIVWIIFIIIILLAVIAWIIGNVIKTPTEKIMGMTKYDYYTNSNLLFLFAISIGAALYTGMMLTGTARQADW